MIKRKTISSLMVIMLVAFAAASSPRTITGIVVDNDNDPVMFATIIYSVKSSRSDTTYTSTDASGFFSIGNLPEADTLNLIIKSLYYEDKECSLNLDANPDTLRFVMDFKSVSLSEVVVRSRYYGIAEHGDTLVFSPGRFSDGTEHNIGDVIRNMPGMVVDENGSVSFQGNKVDKILVDGKDVFSNPGMYINSLPADFASSIEYVSNYKDGDIRDSFRGDSQTALNLKTMAKSQWSGQFDVKGGVYDKYETQNTVLGIHGMHSLSAILNANNTGAQLLSILDYVKSKIGLESLSSSGGATLDISSDEQRLLLPPDNEFSRIGQLGNIDYVYSPSDGYELKAGLLFHHSKSKGTCSSYENYIESGMCNNSEMQTSNDNSFLSTTISNKWTKPGKSLIKNSTSMNYGKYCNESNSDNHFLQYDIYGKGIYKSLPIRIYNEFNINLKLGRGLLFGNLSLFVDRNTQKNHLTTNLPINNIGIYSQPSDSKYSCNRVIKKDNVQFDAGYILPFRKSDINFKTEISYDWALESLIDGTAAEKAYRLGRSNNRIHTFLGIFKNEGKIRYDMGINIGFSSYSFKHSEFSNSQCWTFNPSGMFELYFSNKHRMTLSVNYSQNPVGIEYYANSPWIVCNNTLYTGSCFSGVERNNLNMRLSYRYMSLFNHLTLFAIISYMSNTNDVLAQASTEGITTYQKYMNGGYKQVWQGQAYLNKGIGHLPLEVKMNPKFILTKNNVINSSGSSVLSVSKIELTASAITRFKSFPVNFELEGFYIIDEKNMNIPNIKTTQTVYGISIKSIAKPFRNCIISIEGIWNATDNNHQDLTIFDMNIEASYKHRRYTFGLIGHNILHLRNYEWLAESISSYSVIQSSYRRIPGSLMLFVNYSF